MTEIRSEAQAASISASISGDGRFIQSTNPVDRVQQENYLANLRFNIAVIEMAEKFPQLFPHLRELLVDPRS